MVLPDRPQDLPVSRLALPPDPPVPSTQTDIDTLKEEIKGLSATMLALTSRMTNSTQPNPATSTVVPPQRVDDIPRQPPTTVLPVNTQLVNTVQVEEQDRIKVTRQSSSKVPQDPEEMEVSSDESEEQSSVENQSDAESIADSEGATPPMKSVEGVLDWTSMVSLILKKFQDRIPPEETSSNVSRIGNLGGMVEKKDEGRSKLPMYHPIREELTIFSTDICNPPSKLKAKRDSKPLGRGYFPESQKGLPVQALSGDLRFNHAAQVDTNVEKLLPQKKNTYSIQGRLSEENLRVMERNLRVSLSSLSYVLWNLDFATHSLSEISEDCDERDLFNPIISACKHAMSFLSTVVDRSATSLASTVLLRRDSYLAQMDSLLPEEDQVKLRSASFLDTKLFAGNLTEIIPKLEELRKDSHSRESVEALASLAKKGVESSSSKSTSNVASSSSKKKNSKKFTKKKFSKKNAGQTSGNSTKTSSDQNGANITRTFHNKGKKSGSK